MSGFEIFYVMAIFFAVRFLLPVALVFGAGSYIKKMRLSR
jgi:hypothetical protein